MNTKHLIGLSISLCIRDILQGKVRIEDVKLIIAGTKAKTEQDWEALISQYTYSYWQGNPEGAKVLQALLYSGKIVQPRVMGLEPPNVAHGAWAVQTRF